MEIVDMVDEHQDVNHLAEQLKKQKMSERRYRSHQQQEQKKKVYHVLTPEATIGNAPYTSPSISVTSTGSDEEDCITPTNGRVLTMDEEHKEISRLLYALRAATVKEKTRSMVANQRAASSYASRIERPVSDFVPNRHTSLPRDNQHPTSADTSKSNSMPQYYKKRRQQEDDITTSREDLNRSLKALEDSCKDLQRLTSSASSPGQEPITRDRAASFDPRSLLKKRKNKLTVPVQRSKSQRSPQRSPQRKKQAKEFDLQISESNLWRRRRKGSRPSPIGAEDPDAFMYESPKKRHSSPFDFWRRSEHNHKPHKCHSCRRILTESFVEGAGKRWHREHFVCGKCALPFELVGQPYFEFEGVPYCEKHYDELVADRCYHCNVPITGDAVKVFNKVWCEDCFTCPFCDIRFTLKTKFFEFDMRPVCKRCYLCLPDEVTGRPKKPTITNSFMPLICGFGGKKR
ncbi:uncharacterized protein LOC144923724 isoform X2 [Branchiostoma floridae x Branchiostoma belcheri]